MLQLSMRECIMIVTNPKLYHDWREDWAGTHVRRVGNNWRNNIAHALLEKGAWRGARTHGATWHSESCHFVNILPKKDAARGALWQKMKQSWNYTGSSMLPTQQDIHRFIDMLPK